MFRLGKLFSSLAGGKRKTNIENEIDEELAFHLEMRLQENLAKGMPPEEARREALERFGDVAQIKDMCGEIREGGIEPGLTQDIFFSARMLSNNLSFSVSLVLILSLGIAANVIIFSVINAVLIRPLPYENPDRLVVLAEVSPQIDNMSVSFPNYLDWKNQTRVFEQIAAHREQRYNLTDLSASSEPAIVQGRAVSPNFFTTLGVKPVLGRDFSSPEEKRNVSPVVLSYQFWQRRFGGDPNVAGKKLLLNDADFFVAGVMPSEFRLFGEVDVFTPLEPSAKERADRGAHSGIYLLGRLKDGATMAETRTEMDAVAKSLEQQYPETNTGNRVKITALYDDIYKGIRKTLFVQLGGAALLLLVLSTFIANLLLAKSSGRRKMIAVRKALGISRQRIFKQILIEGIILSFAGGVLATIFAVLALSKISPFFPESILRFNEVVIDGNVLIFTFLILILVGLSLGLAPGLYAFNLFSLSGESNPDDSNAAADVSPVKGYDYIRDALLTLQVALAVTLISLSGLAIIGFLRLNNAPLGFNPQNTVVFRLPIASSSADENAQATNFYQKTLQAIEALPPVESVAFASGVPLTQAAETNFSVIDSAEHPATQYEVTNYEVSPQYHQTLGIPLVSGRFFTEQDAQNESKRVMIIDENIAREIFSGDDPLGRRIAFFDDRAPYEIIGVVRHVKQYKHDDSNDFRFQIYTPKLQFNSKDIFLVARTKQDTDLKTFNDTVRREIWKINANQSVPDSETMQQTFAESLAREKFMALLLAVCSLISALVAIAGVSSAMRQANNSFNTIATESSASPSENETPQVSTKRDFKFQVKRGRILILVGLIIGFIVTLFVILALPLLFQPVFAGDLILVTGISTAFTLFLLLAQHISIRKASKTYFKS